MTDYLDPQSGERIAVLRPEDSKLSLRRLAEWNAILDEADAPGADVEAVKARGNAHWLVMLREQGWRFVGWLSTDTDQTSGGPILAGDLQIPESRYLRDFRRA
jgi:hypothetical protein